MWGVQVSYKGFDQSFDILIEEVGLKEGGTWTGEGYTPGRGMRSIVWEFPTKKEATNYVREVKKVGKVTVTKPWKRKD